MSAKRQTQADVARALVRTRGWVWVEGLKGRMYDGRTNRYVTLPDVPAQAVSHRIRRGQRVALEVRFHNGSTGWTTRWKPQTQTM